MCIRDSNKQSTEELSRKLEETNEKIEEKMRELKENSKKMEEKIDEPERNSVLSYRYKLAHQRVRRVI